MAQHVQNVIPHRMNGISSYIEAKIDACRQVTSTLCSCVYNKSGICKHIAALIYYVNNEKSITKTDMEQQWEKPSVKRLAQEKYSKGKNWCEMFPPRKNKSKLTGPRLVYMSELEDDSPLKTVKLSETKGECELAVKKKLMHDLLDQVDLILAKEDCSTCVKTLLALTENYPTYSCEHSVNIEIANFYASNIVMTEEKIVKLCCDTIEQSNSNEWFEVRKLRFSASKNVHNVKSRIKKTEDSLVQDMLFPRKVETASTKYGVKNELKARQEYEQLYNVSVKQLGVLICNTQPWLCASVDGVVYKEKDVIKIVEIKCPSSCEKKTIIDWDLEKPNVSYLQTKESKVLLKNSSIYYTQCQTQMYVFGLNVCDLFIYSPLPNSCVNITVQRDEEFLNKTIIKCEKFYFQFYLPALYNQFITKEKSSSRFAGKDIINQI